MTFSKKDLIASVADSTGVSQTIAAKTVEAAFASITNALAKKEKVQIVGFGTFDVKHRPARERNNPRTGAPMNVPPKNAVKFTPGKRLKDSVN